LGAESGAVVSSGGTENIYGTDVSAAVSSGGTQIGEAGATASGATVSSGGTQFDAGTASGSIILSGGTATVYGTDISATVSKGGIEIVNSGGTPVVSPAGFDGRGAPSEVDKWSIRRMTCAALSTKLLQTFPTGMARRQNRRSRSIGNAAR
jgi:autotransporter passenger strand-loop-strand repeat protein